MMRPAMRDMGSRLILTLLAAATGCAQPRGPSPMVADISPPREQRKQAVVQEFETNRDQAQYQAALCCWEQGNLAGCRESLQSLLQRNPQHIEANYLLAELYFLNDQPAEAKPILEWLSQQQPDVAGIHHTLGMVLARLGERDQAGRSLQVAADLEPENEAYRHSLERFRAGDADAGEQGRHHLASQSTPLTARAADDVAGSDSLSAQDPLAKTRSQFESACRRGEDSEARALLLQAATEARRDEAVLISLAVMAMRQDQSTWAVQALQTFEAGDVASAAYRRTLGTAYYRTGDYKAAEAQLRQALLLDNTSALSYFLLGCTLSRQRRDQEAETQLRQARLLDPRYDRPRAF